MVQLLTRERLGIATAARRGLSHWGSRDPLAAAELVRRDVLGRGVCLPLVWFCGGMVVPVVSWDLAAVRVRSDSGRGPLLYRSLLADRLQHGRDHLEPAVLQMEAFITVAPLSAARNALAAVSGYAPALAAVPHPPGVDGRHALECDYYGFTVAEVDDTGARIIVRGLQRAKHPEGGVAHQRRLMQEQLFDVALRAGVTPEPT